VVHRLGPRDLDGALESAVDSALRESRSAGSGAGPLDDLPYPSALPARDLGEQLLAKVTQQLDATGFLVKADTLVDATLVAARARLPLMDEGPGASSAADPDWIWAGKSMQATSATRRIWAWMRSQG